MDARNEALGRCVVLRPGACHLEAAVADDDGRVAFLTERWSPSAEMAVLCRTRAQMEPIAAELDPLSLAAAGGSAVWRGSSRQAVPMRAPGAPQAGEPPPPPPPPPPGSGRCTAGGRGPTRAWAGEGPGRPPPSVHPSGSPPPGPRPREQGPAPSPVLPATLAPVLAAWGHHSHPWGACLCTGADGGAGVGGAGRGAAGWRVLGPDSQPWAPAGRDGGAIKE